jgi:thymidylate synthase (FAD)
MDHKQHALYVDHMGSDLSVVKAAKVSFSNDQGIQEFLTNEAVMGTKTKSHEGLINYLANHGHWTPFAHTSITLRMKAALPIRTQCFKHKQGFVENEESRRYIASTPEYFLPTFRKSVENKKQGSGEEFSYVSQVYLEGKYQAHMKASILAYEDALRDGICEEQARFYLPQGMMVNWYWTGSLAAFARFYAQRIDSHAQKEIQELAQEVSNIIKVLYPVCWAALTKG